MLKSYLEFYKGKKVFVTGHTGFKGSWMCKILCNLGAQVTGYALEPPTEPNLFDICKLDKQMNSIIGDVRDFEKLTKSVNASQPNIVFHMAAQPLVRDSYKEPRYTYETNVMGTVNILEAVRNVPSVKSLVNVTTDKVYRNNEWCWGYREDEYLDGYDPYSNSKSCSELVTHTYKRSFFNDDRVAVSTARAGNVIGGGDFSVDRIIPDCVRATQEVKSIIVRNPHSIRPYQHVLEPIFAYLLIAAKQFEDVTYAGSYNVGPDECDCVSTGKLVSLFCDKWNDGISWETKSDSGPHEANFLKLDCSKIKSVFNWYARWNIEKVMQKTVEWYKAYLNNEDVSKLMDNQIHEYMK